MDRPNKEDWTKNGYIVAMEAYTNYLELRVTRLTEGLNDIVTTLQNMQRDGKEG